MAVYCEHAVPVEASRGPLGVVSCRGGGGEASANPTQVLSQSRHLRCSAISPALQGTVYWSCIALGTQKHSFQTHTELLGFTKTCGFPIALAVQSPCTRKAQPSPAAHCGAPANQGLSEGWCPLPRRGQIQIGSPCGSFMRIKLEIL